MIVMDRKFAADHHCCSALLTITADYLIALTAYLLTIECCPIEENSGNNNRIEHFITANSTYNLKNAPNNAYLFPYWAFMSCISRD
ncbi:hypothetical protein D3C76_1718550 [compost metagenome]